MLPSYTDCLQVQYLSYAVLLSDTSRLLCSKVKWWHLEILATVGGYREPLLPNIKPYKAKGALRFSMRILISCVVLGVLMGCSAAGGGIFNDEPYTDTIEDREGHVITADTKRNWEKWTSMVGPQIASEAAGANPPGFSTWNEKWVRQLRHIEATQQNSEMYIRYIVEGRRKAGLPELDGFP